MNRDELDRRHVRGTFVVSAPRDARRCESTPTASRQQTRAVAWVIVTAIGLAVIPEVITHLTVKHSPDLPPLEATGSSDVPIAHLVRFGISGVLLLLSSLVVLMRGHKKRNITGALILLLGLNFPYIVSSIPPGPADLIKIVLANALILALWNMAAPVSVLKWVPIVVTLIGIYSIIGGLIIPDYMMYDVDSEKALIGGWELAGPFGHSTVFGMYSVIAFALVPLITRSQWRILCGSILFLTILLTASRTAQITAGFVITWWLISRFRSVISIRSAGTVFVSLTAIAMLVFPFMAWDPRAFTDRASVWTAAIDAWRGSPVFGLGVNWFLTDAQSTANTASWAYVGTGHNVVIDVLVKSGVVGLVVVTPVWLAAVVAVRRLRVTIHQVACFGYLIAFFVTATTEAIWAMLPNLQMFPISGLIFAVLIVAGDSARPVESPA